MASGRMEFHAQSIMQHANFTFVLPNDVEMEEVHDPRHYDRPTKSIILLHGLTGTDTDWLYGGVAQLMAIQYNLAVFMPTGGNFFYVDKGYRGGNYTEFIGEELPDYIHKVFGLCGSREDTLIGGLSMGGYGAIHTALSYPKRFDSCIALSSAIHIEEMSKFTPEDDEEQLIPYAMLCDIFGDPSKMVGSDLDPKAQYLKQVKNGETIPRIYMAIGEEDAPDLYNANVSYAEFLEKQGADFIFEHAPGKHEWFFWNEYLNKGLEWALQ